MELFKSRHPDYFKDYYQKNKDKFKLRNANRTKKSKRKIFYVIQIDGKKYCFKNKKSMNIQKMSKDELNGDDNTQFV